MALLIVLCVGFIAIYLNSENCLVKKKNQQPNPKQHAEKKKHILIQVTILQECQIHLKFLYVVEVLCTSLV